MRLLISLLSLMLTIAALFVMIWSVVPAPLYRLFMLSVAAGEWSLWFGAVALVGVALGCWGFAVGSPRLGGLSVVVGLLTVALAVKPPIQALGVAAREGVSLSLGRYLFGVRTTSIEETRDIVYATVGGQPLHLDVYRQQFSSPTAAGIPAVVVVHGGSWSGGSKGEFAAMSRALAQDGAVVFDVEYRLAAPAQPFPAQVADVKCAVGWVKANAQTYGVDPQRIALLGRSAGGQLALLAAYAADDPRLQPSCDVGATTVQAVVSFYAPVDLAWGYDHVLQPDVVQAQPSLQNYLGGPPSTFAETYQLANPIAHITPSSPPTLIIHGGFDRLVSVQHAHFLDAALQSVQVPHRLLILPWANHGFDFASNSWGAQISETLVREFLHEHLAY